VDGRCDADERLVTVGNFLTIGDQGTGVGTYTLQNGTLTTNDLNLAGKARHGQPERWTVTVNARLSMAEGASAVRNTTSPARAC